MVVVAALLAGCGGSSSSSPTSPSPSPGPAPGNACDAIGGGAGLTVGITNGARCSGITPVVKLNLKDRSGDAVGTCTGTVIAARAVLTAAHCLDGETAGVKVYPGSGDQLDATSFVAYPGYSGSGTIDVVVVLMSADLPRSPMPLLGSRDPQAGESAIVAGWGVDLNGVIDIVPRAGSTRIARVGPILVETDYSSTTGSVCSGDSGGPLLVSQDGVWTVAGVTSATSQAGSCFGATSYYTKVSNPAVLAFVQQLVPTAGIR